MTLSQVRIELARSKEAPEGDALRAYQFVAPLDDDGHLDASAWKALRKHCTVSRFVKGAVEQHGHLVHVGHGWHFDYDDKRRDDDEPLFKLDRHVLKQGEYVSVTEHDGVQRTFKVVRVFPVPD